MTEQTRALILCGGWEGHDPVNVSNIFASQLRQNGFQIDVSNTLDSLRDGTKLQGLDLIVPVWTMGTILPEQAAPLIAAVEGGVGLAGCHGGMGDAFRNDTGFQFVVGGQFVAHPGNDGVRYMVNITDHDHVITRGISDFEVCSEQYYMHVDPAVKVLATTHVPAADGPHVPNGEVDMPVTWTKMYGKGRVFYTSIGHNASVFDIPEALEMTTRGLLWAARRESA
jgi:type 1 glutamine amidotransferase